MGTLLSSFGFRVRLKWGHYFHHLGSGASLTWRHYFHHLGSGHTYKIKDRVTRTPLNTGGELRCSGRVSSSCSTSGTCHLNNPLHFLYFKHLSSPPVFSGVRVTRSLILYVCSVDCCLSFCNFSFGHCVVCSSIYRFWLHLWYLQALFKQWLMFKLINRTHVTRTSTMIMWYTVNYIHGVIVLWLCDIL
jgi:hypothetical protein